MIRDFASGFVFGLFLFVAGVFGLFVYILAR